MNDNDTSPTQDTEHHLRDGGELLAKVLPAGGPMLGQEPECRRCAGCTNPGACHDDGKGEK